MIALAVVAVFALLLAAVAWASAWQTMHWLGAAEDALDAIADVIDVDGEPLPQWVKVALRSRERRTPRRNA